jgi:IS4 transposase
VTLALHFVRKGEPLVEVLDLLKKRLDEQGIKVELWLADKGFCSVECLRWFDEQTAAYVPLPARGKTNPPTGSRALLGHRISCWERYSLRSDKAGELTFDVAVVRCAPKRCRTSGEMLPAATLLYAVVGKLIRSQGVEGRSAPEVAKVYRKRFGIESSYRQLEAARLRTSSRSPLLRLLAVGIALLLVNLWALVRWVCSAREEPGPRPLEEGFQLQKLLFWIAQQIALKLHYLESISLKAPSLLRF